MKIGITGIENATAAAAMGYDYLEVNASALARLSEEEFQAELVRIQGCGLPAECANVLFSDIQLLTEEDSGRVEAYLSGTLGRLAQLGVKVVVFGSGRARRKPEGMPFAEGWRRLRDVTRTIGSVADTFGMQVAIEPLCRQETNMINTVTEGAALAAAVDLPNVWVLADSYHMFKDGEPLDNLRTVGRLSHVHVALRDGRRYPTYAEGQLYLFIDELHAIGYNGRITIEANTRCFAQEGPLALAALRMLTDQLGQ